jgi:hypothetical protein
MRTFNFTDMDSLWQLAYLRILSRWIDKTLLIIY